MPTARELAPNAAARELIEFTETPLLSMAWPFVAPPGVPAGPRRRVADRLSGDSRDPDYLADAAAEGSHRCR